MENPNDTLFGERTLPVNFENGTTGEMTIKQLRVSEYKKALPLMDDEAGLIALSANTNRGVVESLHPDSYEQAYVALKEVNARGFFIWLERQLERGAASLKYLPPSLVEKAIAPKLQPSAMPSPRSPRNAA